MSFHTTIARLREAVHSHTPGEAPGSCRVSREDLRVALDVIYRLDADLRRSGTLTSDTLRHASRITQDHQAAAVRLTKLAQETRAIYSRETFGGGEPVYPSWTGDVLLLAALAPTNRGPDHA